jgi:hypothetical protein
MTIDIFPRRGEAKSMFFAVVRRGMFDGKLTTVWRCVKVNQTYVPRNERFLRQQSVSHVQYAKSKRGKLMQGLKRR